VTQRPDGGPELFVFRVVSAFLTEARQMKEDGLGPEYLLSRFQNLSINLGPRFESSPLLAELVREGHTFYSRFP